MTIVLILAFLYKSMQICATARYNALGISRAEIDTRRVQGR